MKLTPLRGKVREALLEYLEKRFGIERGVFEGLELMDNGKGRVFALSREAAIFALGNNIMSASLPFARLDGAVKPTSAMIQAFGRLAGSGVITLDKKHAKEFAEGYDIDVKGHGCTDGYVILKYHDRPLGCGMLRENKIKNMLPKAKRMSLELL
jgi:hypothetical protein